MKPKARYQYICLEKQRAVGCLDDQAVVNPVTTDLGLHGTDKNAWRTPGGTVASNGSVNRSRRDDRDIGRPKKVEAQQPNPPTLNSESGLAKVRGRRNGHSHHGLLMI